MPAGTKRPLPEDNTEDNTAPPAPADFVALPFYGEHKKAVSACSFAPTHAQSPFAPGHDDSVAAGGGTSCADADADTSAAGPAAPAVCASASADGTVKLWKLTSEMLERGAVGTEAEQQAKPGPIGALRTLHGHARGINDVAWSPTAEYLATASDDKSLRIWDAETGAALVELRGHTNYVFSCAFSPQTNLLVSGSFDETVKLWDVRSGDCVSTLPAHSDPVTGVDFNRDGTCVVSGSHDGLIRIWDTMTGECLKTIYAGGNPPVSYVPDHPAVVSGYQITQPIAITDQMFIAKGVLSPRRVAEWLYRGSGPCATTGCDTGGFFSTRAGLQQPDLQMRFVCGLGTSPDGVSSYRDIGRQGKTPSGITLQSLAIRPQARGTVTLRSRDPSDPPLLDVGYGTSPADLATLRAGLRIAREIVMQPAFESVRGEEAWPRLDLDDDAALDDYIASTVHSGNALAGSCKMGRTTSDPMAVVSSEDLRVRGVANLRVVDASILPTMPGGQLGATVFAIAERAADMILSGAGELQRSREAATPQ